jgi:hypothetical protein
MWKWRILIFRLDRHKIDQTTNRKFHSVGGCQPKADGVEMMKFPNLLAQANYNNSKIK